MKLSVEIIKGSAIALAQWDAFMLSSPQSAIYADGGYLQALTPQWEAVIVSADGKWEAVMPIFREWKWALPVFIQPLFSQYWGVFFSAGQEISYQEILVRAILDALPKHYYFEYRFAPSFQAEQPFIQRKYTLSHRQTYCVSLQETNLSEVLHKSTARQVKKAEKQGYLFCETDDGQVLRDLIERQRRNGKNLLGVKNTSQALLQLNQIMAYLCTAKKGRLYYVSDTGGKILASGLYTFYNNRATYLIGAYLPESSDSGAMSFLMWNVLQKAKQENYLIFDFEGSMIVSIARFFRNFGATPVSYISLSQSLFPFNIL